MPQIPEWLTFLIDCTAAYYVLTPVLIKITHTYRASVDYEAIDVASLPANVRDHFSPAAHWLAAEGFSRIGILQLKGAVRGVTAYIMIWCHRSNGQIGNCVAVAGQMGIRSTYYSFETILSPLLLINTNSISSAPGVFEGAEFSRKCSVPQARDMATLYRIHLSRERDLVTDDAIRYLPDPSRIIEAARSESLYILRDQVRRGLYYESNQAGVFRPTWFGAYLMTYRLLPPMKQFRVFARRRAGQRAAAHAAVHPAEPRKNVPHTDQSPYESPLSADRLTYG